MRLLQTQVAGRALLALLIVAVIGAGCGGDDGGSPPPPPPCAISDLNTSQQNAWLTGDIINIRWLQNGVPGTVVIELLKAGAVVDTIAAAAANSGFYPWLADISGQSSGSDFGFRVTGTGTAACTDQVDGLTIRDVNGCSYTYTAGADSVQAGDEFEITWLGVNTSGVVDIELWTSGIGGLLGDKVGDIAIGAPDNGSYTWTVDSFNNGTYDFYRYVIRDAQVADCSVNGPRFRMIDDDICTIGVTGPPMAVDLGDTVLIQLEQRGGSGFVDLRLYMGNEFLRGGVIADNVSVLDNYKWAATDFGNLGDNTRYNIRAVGVADPYCVGRSDDFTINR